MKNQEAGGGRQRSVKPRVGRNSGQPDETETGDSRTSNIQHPTLNIEAITGGPAAPRAGISANWWLSTCTPSIFCGSLFVNLRFLKPSAFHLQSSTIHPLPLRPTAATGIRSASAFSLIELISVLAIISVLFTLALGAYLGWTRASGIDQAANLVATVLQNAREQSIAQNQNMHLACTNLPAMDGRPERGYFTLYSAGTNNDLCQALPSVRLPPNVRFDTPMVVEFRPDGTVTRPDLFDPSDRSDSFLRIALASPSPSHSLTNIIEVYYLTGRVRIKPRGETP